MKRIHTHTCRNMFHKSVSTLRCKQTRYMHAHMCTCHTHVLHLYQHQTEMQMIGLVECCLQLTSQQDYLVHLRFRKCKVEVRVLYLSKQAKARMMCKRNYSCNKDTVIEVCLNVKPSSVNVAESCQNV